MPTLRNGLWIALGAGLLGTWLPALEAQGLQPSSVQAQQKGEESQEDPKTGQEQSPEERARAQAASRPMLGKKPSAKAVRPKESPNVLPSWPFTKPFRYFNPTQQAEPNKQIVDMLKRLDYARALYIRSKKRGADVHGRPYIQDAAFVELMDGLKPQLTNMQAYLIYLIRDHANISYRRAAHFGALYLPAMRQTFDVISYAPCEPDRDTRHYAMLMGAPMLRKYLPSRGPESKPVTVDPRSKGPKPPYTYPFNSDPYLNLLRAPTVEERLYALSFLRILAGTRPDQTAEQVRRMERFFLDGIRSSNKDIAKVTRYVINDLAIATRSTTDIQEDCPEDSKEVVVYFHKLLNKLFPDIRIRGGIVEMHEGTELRQTLSKLSKLCKEGKLGFRDSQQVGDKQSKRMMRGLRLREYEILETIGLKPGLLITAINGTPLMKAQEVPELIGKMLKARQYNFAVTFVNAEGKERVLQYRYKAKQ